MGWTRANLQTRALLVLGIAVILGCAKGSSDEVVDGGGGGSSSEGSEKTYNGTPISYSGNLTTVTANMTYARYDDGATGLATTSVRPIRYAEVHILDSSGSVIQAGETDGSGNVSMIIPRTAGSYTLSVNSRADNNYLKASVLNNPFDKTYYSHKTTFTLDGSETTKAVTPAAAPYDGTLEGGAFNILDDVFIANQFLRDQANDPTNCSICSNDFTVAPKIPIYWTKGISPGVYYGQDSVGISFFAASSGGGIYRGLYILGGIKGSLCADTDHFDNSVILHEYGHFLENAYGKSASPGGSHDGNSLIDPRLAWSEGWADFFQAAALGRHVYRDTSKNASCTGGAKLSFPDFNLELKQSSDVPLANEGIFREVSIARTLYDTMTGSSQSTTYSMDYNVDGVAGDRGFAQLWHIFKSFSGVGKYFQNMGMFNLAFKEMLAASPFNMSSPNVFTGNTTSVLDHEKQAADRSLYGQRLTPTTGSAGACSFTFNSGDPSADEKSGGTVTWSDPLRNNDFFEYYYDGTAAKSVIELKYKKLSGTITNPYDLDLFAYKQDYVYMDYSTIAASSENVYPEKVSDTSYPGYETISFSGLSPGVYMINIKVDYTATRADTTYFLQNPNGAQLCP